MTGHLYTFNTSPEQLRRQGARAVAERSAARAEVVPLRVCLAGNRRRHLAILDAGFPWLRGA